MKEDFKREGKTSAIHINLGLSINKFCLKLWELNTRFSLNKLDN